jgi:hypothetical protein
VRGEQYLQRARGPTCFSTIYLDRHLIYAPGALEPVPPPVDLRQYSIESLESIEWYSGASQLPAEYSGLNNTCGVLVMHTRRSESPPAPKKKPPRSN